MSWIDVWKLRYDIVHKRVSSHEQLLFMFALPPMNITAC